MASPACHQFRRGSTAEARRDPRLRLNCHEFKAPRNQQAGPQRSRPVEGHQPTSGSRPLSGPAIPFSFSAEAAGRAREPCRPQPGSQVCKRDSALQASPAYTVGRLARPLSTNRLHPHGGAGYTRHQSRCLRRPVKPWGLPTGWPRTGTCPEASIWTRSRRRSTQRSNRCRRFS